MDVKFSIAVNIHINHYQQLRSHFPGSPIFISAISGDTHFPYFVDSDFGKYTVPLNLSDSKYLRIAKYIRVVKQTDEYWIYKVLGISKNETTIQS